jgi:hypothetical protein
MPSSVYNNDNDDDNDDSDNARALGKTTVPCCVERADTSHRVRAKIDVIFFYISTIVPNVQTHTLRLLLLAHDGVYVLGLASRSSGSLCTTTPHRCTAVLFFERQDEFGILLLQCIHVIVVLLVQGFLILLVLGRQLFRNFVGVVLAAQEPTDRAACHDSLPTKAISTRCNVDMGNRHSDVYTYNNVEG